MANERLYQFPSKASPVAADIIYAGDSANTFDEVNITISALIGVYPNLLDIGGLTLGANTYPYVNNLSVFTAGSITALAVSLLADSTISTMQSTLGFQSSPAASLFAGWDANKNLSANSMINGYTTTATAATTTTLVVGSTWQQFFTGSTTQTVLLPVTSTLVLGQSFYIVNNSSGAVTVQSSGANNIQVMAANTTLMVTCILTSGTTAASWYADYNFQNALTLPLSIANGGTAVSSVTIAPAATSWAGWDANKNLSANSLIEGYTTTATAAGTTTLTVGSAYSQFFTGSTTQTVLMPVTSTLALGQQYYIVNNSSGVVTVQSSGANNIVAMAANTAALLTCVLTSGTTAASWYAEYEQASLTLPLAMTLGGTGASLIGANNSLVYTSSSTTMALLATANNSVLGTDGSGNLSWLTTLPTNIALTTPEITTSIKDANGNTILGLTPAASAVNYIRIVNEATGFPAQIGTDGSDSSIPLGIFVKNGYIIFQDSTATAAPSFRWYNTANTHYVSLVCSGSQASDINFTFPTADAAGAMFSDGSGNLSLNTTFSTSAWTDFSGTIGYTGFSGTPTTNLARYKLVGKILFFEISMTGTSNATGFTITNMPVSAARTLAAASPLYQGVNAGSSSYQVQFSTTASSTTLTMLIANNAAGWTNSGTKSVNFTGFYETT